MLSLAVSPRYVQQHNILQRNMVFAQLYLCSQAKKLSEG